VRESEADLREVIEDLRKELHRLVGPSYDERRIQRAREVSRRIDELVLEIMRTREAAE